MPPRGGKGFSVQRAWAKLFYGFQVLSGSIALMALKAVFRVLPPQRNHKPVSFCFGHNAGGHNGGRPSVPLDKGPLGEPGQAIDCKLPVNQKESCPRAEDFGGFFHCRLHSPPHGQKAGMMNIDFVNFPDACRAKAENMVFFDRLSKLFAAAGLKELGILKFAGKAEDHGAGKHRPRKRSPAGLIHPRHGLRGKRKAVNRLQGAFHEGGLLEGFACCRGRLCRHGAPAKGAGVQARGASAALLIIIFAKAKFSETDSSGSSFNKTHCSAYLILDKNPASRRP